VDKKNKIYRKKSMPPPAGAVLKNCRVRSSR